MGKPAFLQPVVKPVTAVTFDDAIAHLLARCRSRGLAANSLKAYSADLADLVRYASTQGVAVMGLLSERMVEGWLDDQGRRGISPRSQARRLSALRRLVRHAQVEGWIAADPTKDTAVKFRARRVTAPEMSALLAMINDIAPLGASAKRDRAMLRLALDAGLRVGEVAALNLYAPGEQYCVDLDRLLVHAPRKGGGTDTVCIDAITVGLLREWLAVRHQLAREGETALFVSSKRVRFHRQSLHALVVRRAKAAGIDHMHWHLLRHRRIGDLVERMGPQVGQVHARHENMTTTVNVYGQHVNTVLHSQIRANGALPAGV